ncbi:uncharacterized protein LOC114322863 isoform X4 [Camellia sinensis]|uniref:uncharacterized protein LOC114322863 isoform X4 n=1 Tax=Camellia sinensis TaxID=4442 RepID=UPI0010368292|nr:uncharacterized protein LOC114322863 isoform X4 [Camellia sinensis]XP_028126094.1 uncharacterized protein LOC114322863 isoform X4 [Camellia sinensis]
MPLQTWSFSSGVVCHRLSHSRNRRSFISDYRLLKRKTKASSAPPTTFVWYVSLLELMKSPTTRFSFQRLGSCQSLSLLPSFMATATILILRQSFGLEGSLLPIPPQLWPPRCPLALNEVFRTQFLV